MSVMNLILHGMTNSGVYPCCKSTPVGVKRTFNLSQRSSKVSFWHCMVRHVSKATILSYYCYLPPFLISIKFRPIFCLQYQTIENIYLFLFPMKRNLISPCLNKPFTKREKHYRLAEGHYRRRQLEICGDTRPAEKYYIILYENVHDAPYVGRTERLETTGTATLLGLQCFLHNHKLAIENFENLVVIAVEVIHEDKKRVVYANTFNTNRKVP